jgi:ectoine hydroxylase-related dioxygenase (phytanoyl-CoA dioxygenase family)
MGTDGLTPGEVSSALPPSAAAALERTGFAVISGPFPAERFSVVAHAYDAAVGAAAETDVRVGSTSTRVTDFVNRGPVFDSFYVYPPLLDAAARFVGHPFKLSSFHARTLHAGADELDIHVDVERDSRDWPLLGFILMVDAFSSRNGATRFLPGSHRWTTSPRSARLQDYAAALESACGPAGSLLVFNGSTWHGQGINESGQPRRSLQGAFIPREGRAWTDFAGRMSATTRARLSAVARRVLAIPHVCDPASAPTVDSV